MVAPLLAVVGLRREAVLVGGRGVLTEAGGGDAASLGARLERRAAAEPVRAVVSVGLGGALSPELGVGDWVVGERVVRGREAWACDPALVAQLRADLGANSLAGRVHTGVMAASDTMVTDPAAKARLYASTDALAVDMESHVAAAFAAARGLPFAVLRVVSDAADRALPKAAQAGMKPDGGMDLAAVLLSLAREPRQLPALIRTGREAEVAFGRLRLLGRHDLLGRLGVGDLDLGELALDVV